MSTQTTGNYPNLTAQFGAVTFIDPVDAGQKAYYEACRTGTPIKAHEAEAIAESDPECLEAYNVYKDEYLILQKVRPPTK